MGIAHQKLASTNTESTSRPENPITVNYILSLHSLHSEGVSISQKTGGASVFSNKSTDPILK